MNNKCIYNITYKYIQICATPLFSNYFILLEIKNREKKLLNSYNKSYYLTQIIIPDFLNFSLVIGFFTLYKPKNISKIFMGKHILECRE